ncbi:hypothetical protein ACOL3F_10995 [Aliarcobacter butzleri]
MAQLNDMEELLHQITDSEIKDYMREAMSCYYANAYRGCIVLSVIAMFEDLMRKLKELSFINGRARCVYNLLAAKQEDQDVFENEMLEQLCSNNIISKLEKDIFNNIKILRHKSAHPSGHKPSSEEARYVFSEVILKVLTKPLLKTTHLIEEIIKRLKNENYFPSKESTIIKSIVKNEIENLHYDSYALLIVKLTEKIENSTLNEELNRKLFLYGLSLQCDNNLTKQIANIFVKNYVDDLRVKIILTALFTKENKLLEEFKEDSITLQRLNSMLIYKINNEKNIGSFPNTSHTFFRENSELIYELNLYQNFQSSIELIFEKYEYSFPKELLVFNEFKTTVVDKYKNNAKSSRFLTSNEFVEKYEHIDAFLVLEPSDAFEICKNIKIAANGHSYLSKSYYNNYFESFPNLKKLANEYTKSLPSITEIDEDLIDKICNNITQSNEPEENENEIL